jgi:GxxExxY protein
MDFADPRFENEDPLTSRIIGAAIAVHKALGPGLLENVYHECMKIELEALGMKFESELVLPLTYRGRTLKGVHRLDLLVEELVIVEIKAIETLLKVHEAQVATYLRLTSKHVGLLLNFNTPYLREGIKRIVR